MSSSCRKRRGKIQGKREERPRGSGAETQTGTEKGGIVVAFRLRPESNHRTRRGWGQSAHQASGTGTQSSSHLEARTKSPGIPSPSSPQPLLWAGPACKQPPRPRPLPGLGSNPRSRRLSGGQKQGKLFPYCPIPPPRSFHVFQNFPRLPKF